MCVRKNIISVYVVSFLFALSAFFLFKNLGCYGVYEKELNLAAVGIYSWIPGCFALYFAKKEKLKINVRCKLGMPFIFASLMPLLIAGLGIFFSLPFSVFSLNRVLEATQVYHLSFPREAINITLFVLALYGISFITSISLNFFFNLGQELFWRGYIWVKYDHLNFAMRCFTSGLLYSLWFAPLIIFFGHNYSFQKSWGVVLMLGFSLALTPILSFLREKEKGVMSSTIFYSLILTFCPIDVVFFPEGNQLLIAPLGIAGILSLFCVAIPIMYVMHQKRYKAA
jgi:hypothetical protein